MKKIQKNDFVQVISGGDKGRTGKVIEVLGDKVVVDRVNVVKRHQKAGQAGGPSGIVEKSLPIHISNVMLFDAKSSKPSRAKVVEEDGNKVRKYVKSGQTVEKASA